MTLNVGINGFGRMGRLTFRAAWGDPVIAFKQINDPAGDPVTLAHLLNFDSVHGRWAHEAHADGDAIVIDGRRIPVTRNKELTATDWSGCDVVIEASGKFRKPEVLQPYLESGQLAGLVSGFDGGAAYQALRTEPLSAQAQRKQMLAVGVQNGGAVALLIILAAGNMARLFRRERRG